MPDGRRETCSCAAQEKPVLQKCEQNQIEGRESDEICRRCSKDESSSILYAALDGIGLFHCSKSEKVMEMAEMDRQLKEDHGAQSEYIKLRVGDQRQHPNNCQKNGAVDQHEDESGAKEAKGIDVPLEIGRELVTAFHGDFFMCSRFIEASTLHREGIVRDVKRDPYYHSRPCADEEGVLHRVGSLFRV